MTIYIVSNEDTSEILGAFSTRENALQCISENNTSKDNLILTSEIVR